MSQKKLEKRRKLVLTYYEDIVHYLGKFGLDREDLKDAINETFIIAYEKVGSLRDEDAMRYWLLKIAKNTGLKYKQKYNREAPIAFIEDVKEYMNNDAYEEDVADEVIRNADNKLLNECLCKLSKREYIILTLQYKYDEKLADIAVITGESINNVKSISRRAKEKLKKLLIEGGYTHGK